MAKRSVPEPPEPEPTPLTIAESCAVIARDLVNEHFKDSSKIDTDGLRSLRTLTTRLETSSDSAAAFNDFVDLLEDSSAVSAFEIQASGILPALVKYLSGKGLHSDKQKLARIHSSAARLMSRKGGVTTGAVSGEYSVVPVAKKLVSVLETMDEFELKTTPQPRFSPSAFSRNRSVNFMGMNQYQQALYALTQPLKISLRSAAGSKLRDCTASTVLVEPLARLSAVEDFVTSRTRPHESSRGGSGGGGASRSGAGASMSGGAGAGAARVAAGAKAGTSGAGGSGSGAAAAAAAAPEPGVSAAKKRGAAGSSGLGTKRGSGGLSGKLAGSGAAADASGSKPRDATKSDTGGAARSSRSAAAAAAAGAAAGEGEQQDEDMAHEGNDQDAGFEEAYREAFEDAQQHEDDVDDDDDADEDDADDMEDAAMHEVCFFLFLFVQSRCRLSMLGENEPMCHKSSYGRVCM